MSKKYIFSIQCSIDDNLSCTEFIDVNELNA